MCLTIELYGETKFITNLDKLMAMKITLGHCDSCLKTLFRTYNLPHALKVSPSVTVQPVPIYRLDYFTAPEHVNVVIRTARLAKKLCLQGWP